MILQTCHLSKVKYNTGDKAESLEVLANLEIKCLAKNLPFFFIILLLFEKVESQTADTFLGTAESVGMLLNYVLESSELENVD